MCEKRRDNQGVTFQLLYHTHHLSKCLAACLNALPGPAVLPLVKTRLLPWMTTLKTPRRQPGRNPLSQTYQGSTKSPHPFFSIALDINDSVGDDARAWRSTVAGRKGRVREEEVSDGVLSHAEVDFSDEHKQPPPKRRKVHPDAKGKGGRQRKSGMRTYFDEVSTQQKFDRQENRLLAQIKMRVRPSVRARVKRKRS